MSLKKNTISYITWIILLFFTGAACTFFGMVLAQMANLNVVLVAIGLVTGFFVVVLLMYFLTGYIGGFCKKQKRLPVMLNLKAALEKVVIITLISIGFVIRILLLSTAGEDAAYYEVSKVTEQGGILVQSVQGSVYFYCMLLHGLFRIVGNHWIAGIWLQIVLQLLGVVILYLGLKKILGRIPAIMVLCFLLFTPFGINAGLTYSPHMLYFCIYALIFFFVADYLEKSTKMQVAPMPMWLYAIWLGVLLGICCYIDITGCLLIIPVLCLPMVKRDEDSTVWVKREVVILVVSIVSFSASIWIDSILSHATISSVLNAWSIIYGYSGFSFDIIVQELSVEFVVLVSLACIGSFSFWRRKDTERFTLFVFMVMGCSVLIFSGITTENMRGSYLLCVLLAILASVSVTELFYNDKIYVPETESGLVMESTEVDNNLVERKVEYIENPLPLPKKHVRKAMDYAFIPEDWQMKYDVTVSDTDDFDYDV